MKIIGLIGFWALEFYLWILFARIIIEMIQAFSRQFRPPRWFATIAEPLFVITDPPVKMLRRVIPPLRLGGVALDVSILVLFLLITLAKIPFRILMLQG